MTSRERPYGDAELELHLLSIRLMFYTSTVVGLLLNERISEKELKEEVERAGELLVNKKP